MAEEIRKTVRIFYSSSPKDAQLRDALVNQLRPQKYITHLHDGIIQVGTEWKKEVGTYLDTADIILLLISSDFPFSSQEVERALERHKKGVAHVIPIILRPVSWENTPFGELRALPRDGKPVVLWNREEEALYEIAREILSVAKEIFRRKCLDSAEEYKSNKQYEEALKVYEQAIHVDRRDPLLYQYKGDLLLQLERFNEAYASYRVALKIAPENVQLWQSLGRTLVKLERYEEALTAYERAAELTPYNAGFKMKIGDIYLMLNNFEKSINAYKEAISLEPENAWFHVKKGDALLWNDSEEEAMVSYDEAIRIQPMEALFYSKKGDALLRNKGYKDALVAYEEAIRLQGDNSQFYKNKARVLSSWARAEGDSISCYERALIAYENAISLDPNDPFLYKEMGDVYSILKRLDNALEAYEDAIRIKPSFGPAHRNKGKVFDEMANNYKRQAQQAYDEAKKYESSE